MVRSSQPYLFASFSSQDLDVVDRVVDQLEVLGVPVWAAHRNLQPGEAWSETITHALSGASGVLIFISKTSLQSLWAKRELTSAINSQKRAFPIVVGNVDIGNLPAELRCSAPLRGVSGDRQDTIISVCDAIQKALQNDPEWQSGKTVFDARTTKEMASDISADLEEAQDQPSVEGGEENSVFVVHGHDANFVDQVVAYVSSIGVKPIVLTRMGSDEQSLFQRFFRYGQRARFAIVLVGADDIGASRAQYDMAGVGERALQFRARQNVILELGFFFGKLGWQNVFVLLQPPDKIFPNFERPSDLDGVLFNNLDGKGSWKKELAQRLAQAKLQVTL
jgi:predicted nucleotide-binding protein